MKILIEKLMEILFENKWKFFDLNQNGNFRL